ncbi:helix-turn-helix domain-containing protein [Agarilytica rhodophyticola]|uniref:helix-turn-helix domain-containing protein n=1 Tax=Agarilytica rhodophyticola TaxID=1737490 RepID=UPI000B341E13|nr:helix-turn-helix transcriptional regulator [Agarilytica rhodophyticola]
MSKKKILSEEEIAECLALKKIYDEKKAKLKLTQEALGDALGGISQAAVSHYLNGTNPLNVRVAIVFSRLLRVPISDFSSRLSRDAELPPNIDDDSRMSELAEAVRGLEDRDFIELIELAKTKKKLSGVA